MMSWSGLLLLVFSLHSLSLFEAMQAKLLDQHHLTKRQATTDQPETGSSDTPRRHFVSPNGQPYYQYRPPVHTTHRASSAAGRSATAQVRVRGQNEGEGQTGVRTRYGRRRSSNPVQQVRTSRTYHYPFGRERIQYQYVTEGSNGQSTGVPGSSNPTGPGTYNTRYSQTNNNGRSYEQEYRRRLQARRREQLRARNEERRRQLERQRDGQENDQPTQSQQSNGQQQSASDSGSSSSRGAYRRSSYSNNQRDAQAQRTSPLYRTSSQQRTASSTTDNQQPTYSGSSTYQRRYSSQSSSGSVPSSQQTARGSTTSQGTSYTPRQRQTYSYNPQRRTSYTSTNQQQRNGNQPSNQQRPRTGYVPTTQQQGYASTSQHQGTRYTSTNQNPFYRRSSQQQTSYQTRYQPAYGSTTGTGSPPSGTYVYQPSRIIIPNQRGSSSTTRTQYTYGMQGQGLVEGQGVSQGQGQGQGFRYVPQYNPYNNRGYNNGYYTQTTNSECPETGVELRFNGMDCRQALTTVGYSLCYTHENNSRQCCELCRARKQASRVGCEYGDHADYCRSISAPDCYDIRNRHTCCDTCERLRRTDTPAGCEYGDMTHRCQEVRRNPGLCYIPDNQRLCCETCNQIRNGTNPGCPWGNYNEDFCQIWDGSSSNIRINCYTEQRQRMCCRSCERLRDWLPDDLPADCQYGDRPVIFSTTQFGQLNCTTIFNHFADSECWTNPAVSVNCCYTCHRRSNRNRG